MPPDDPTTADPALEDAIPAVPGSGPEDATLALPAALTLTWADTLHGELQRRLARDAVVLVDGAAVERASTPCLQLLVAAATAARGQGGRFQLANPSTVLAAAVRELGLQAALMSEQGGQP